MSASNVAGILGPGGALARALGGYEHRPEQLHMAQAVEAAFRDRHFLMVEAGTGTGKTLAYLVPALLSGRKVVVSTATKTLQDQIFFKDLPLLREKVKLDFEASYLKGRSNYLCLYRFESFSTAPTFARRDEAELWPTLTAWAGATETGDRAELDLPETFSAWRELTATSDSCLGARCPLYESCFVTRMRRKAESSDLVVVNHHLFFADLALRSKVGAEGILPRYDAVIFDEAHGLEDAATSFFGSSVSSFRLEELSNDAQKVKLEEEERGGMLAALALKARGDGEALFRGVGERLSLRREGSVRVTDTTFDPLATPVRAVLASLAALSAFAANAEEPEVLTLGRRSAEIANDLEFVTRADSADHVYWAEGRGRGVFLRAAPIEIAEALRKTLYAQVDTVVFTSATLRADGRFDFFSQRMGLASADDAQPPVEKLFVKSSFDYPNQAALYLPANLPEPNAPGFVEAVVEELLALCDVTQGRAFALFTSVRNMEAAHGLARDRLPYPVYLQGERPKAVLLDLFRQEPSVLFATHSFWEGVDVPGDALSLVVIDKLPFASPQDPLVAARVARLEKEGQEPFSAYQVPSAAIALQQGFGRLIRTRQDRGVVAILDKRMTTKGYGRAFLRSLPPARRVMNLEALRRFFEAER